jgi:hypothetical protein
MPQFVAEQVLIVLHAGRIGKRPERPFSVSKEVPHAPTDQEANEVIVHGPPWLATNRYG